MKIAAVLDSTCLIGLERIGRLDLLTALLDALTSLMNDPEKVASQCAFRK